MASCVLFLLFFLKAGADFAFAAGGSATPSAADGAPGDVFGRSVSVFGDTAVAGAYGDDENGESAGAAIVFVRDGSGNWQQQAKLIAADGASADRFGYSVSLFGDTAVIGAYWDDDNGRESGSAYVFVRDDSGSWKQQAKLTASDGAANDRFGSAVSVFGDTVVIGAYYDDDEGKESGSAYVFVRGASGRWRQQTKLTAADGGMNDWFGRAVSISGDSALIGAKGARNTGSAYVFVRDRAGRWREQTKLTAADGRPGDDFGCSVSLFWDTAVIGACNDDDKGTDSGSAYVFVGDGQGNWAKQAKLTASDGSSGDRFGFSVSVFADTAAIGTDKGAVGVVYVFVRDESGIWREQEKLAADGGVGK